MEDQNRKNAEYLRGKALMALAGRACHELRKAVGPGRKVGIGEAREVAGSRIGAAIVLALAQAASTKDPAKLEAIVSGFSPKSAPNDA